jgi:hypothetical protein
MLNQAEPLSCATQARFVRALFYRRTTMTDTTTIVRTIKTVYHIHGKEPKVIRSMNANRAVTQCVAHMQINQYGSHIAEVYDNDTGELHAQIKRDVKGTLTIYFRRDPSQYETKYAISHLIGG